MSVSFPAGSGRNPAEFEFGTFKVKNLASSENNFSEVHEKLYWFPLSLAKQFSLKCFWSICSNVYAWPEPRWMESQVP